MTGFVRSSALVAAALWTGILFCLGFIVAPYLFILASKNSPAVPNTGVAADLIGPLLYSSDILGLVIGAGLIVAIMFLRWRGQVPLGGKLFLSETMVAVAAICAAVNYFVVSPRIRLVRSELAQQYGEFHLADRADPLFLQFDGLHQTSTVLFTVGFLAALACLVCLTHFRSTRPALRADA
jgi:hypothetical protein